MTSRPVPSPVFRGPFPLIAAVVLLSAACVSRTAAPPRTAGPPAAGAGRTLLVQVDVDGRRVVRRLGLEDYVRGSVPAEMPVGQADPAVAERLARLQAVLARTYALANLGRHRDAGFDLCSDTHCQVYRPADEQPPAVARIVAQAVAATRGLVISDDTGPIQALFHADCGGHTSSATVVWGGPAPPYLAGVPDQFCLTSPPDDWHLRLEPDHLRRIFNTAADTRVGRRLDRLQVLERDTAGRVVAFEIVGERRVVVRGERVRAVVAAQLGARAFRSSRFTVARSGALVEFTGSGFGHGVGLCQTGAIARARRGHSVESILAFYYPGTRLVPLAALAD